MAIYISNALYLSSSIASNTPLIGWNSCFSNVDISSADSEVGFYPSAVWSADTYSFWQAKPAGVSGATSTPSITFDNPAASNVDYIAFAGHAGIGSFLCEYSMDGTTWDDVDDDGVRVIDSDAPIMIFFNTLSLVPFFRITFYMDFSTVARLAHVKIGSVLALQRPRYVGDIPGGMNISVEKIGSKSYAGQHLGSVLISQGESFSITQENNTPEFVRSTGLQNFFKHSHRLIKLSEGPVETFFYAWRPKDYPNEIQYCGEITSFDPPSNARSNGMMSWSMKGDAFI